MNVGTEAQGEQVIKLNSIGTLYEDRFISVFITSYGMIVHANSAASRCLLELLGNLDPDKFYSDLYVSWEPDGYRPHDVMISLVGSATIEDLHSLIDEMRERLMKPPTFRMLLKDFLRQLVRKFIGYYADSFESAMLDPLGQLYRRRF